MAIFNTNAETISLRFTCPYCGAEERTDPFSVPTPNFAGENVEESENDSEESHSCTECEREFTINIYNNMCNGNVSITDENNDEIEIIEVIETITED